MMDVEETKTAVVEKKIEQDDVDKSPIIAGTILKFHYVYSIFLILLAFVS